MRRRGIDRWLTHASPCSDGGLRLICFHYAGGNASTFRGWHSRLPRAVDVWAVQLPGRMNRFGEPPFTRMSELMPVLGPVVASLFDRPVAFFGYSLGTLVAFEAARWLRRHRGQLPVHLFVAAGRAPQCPRDVETHYETDEKAIARMQELNGTSAAVLRNPEFLGVVLPIVRADFELAETYEYSREPPLDCSITAIGGTTDPETQGERLAGWRDQTTGAFVQRVLDGDHFFISSQEPLLLDILGEELTRWTARPSRPAPRLAATEASST